MKKYLVIIVTLGTLCSGESFKNETSMDSKTQEEIKNEGQ